jgi:hypothetical protein
MEFELGAIMGSKKKAAPRASATAQHTAALREHSRALKDHTLMLAKALASNQALSGALDEHTKALTKPSPVREKIRARIAKAIFSKPQALGDAVKVSSQVQGGSAAGDAMVANINNEFWPHANVIHLTFDEIKDMTFGDLITLILEILKM